MITKINKILRLSEVTQGIHDFMLNCSSGLTVHRLKTFILSCSSFLTGRCGSVFSCDTAHSSAAIGVKMIEHGTVP